MSNELTTKEKKKAINLQDLIYVKKYILDQIEAAKNQLDATCNKLLSDLSNGTVTVEKATSATNATNAKYATSADKATNDGNGNKISDTYYKKTDTVKYAKSLSPYLIGTISNPIAITDGQTLSIPVGDTLINAMKSIADFPIIYLVVKTSNVSDASFIPLMRTGFELKKVTGSDAYECIQAVFEAGFVSKLTDAYSYCQKYLLTWNKGNSNVQLTYETISLKNN